MLAHSQIQVTNQLGVASAVVKAEATCNVEIQDSGSSQNHVSPSKLRVSTPEPLKNSSLNKTKFSPLESKVATAGRGIGLQNHSSGKISSETEKKKTKSGYGCATEVVKTYVWTGKELDGIGSSRFGSMIRFINEMSSNEIDFMGWKMEIVRSKNTAALDAIWYNIEGKKFRNRAQIAQFLGIAIKKRPRSKLKRKGKGGSFAKSTKPGNPLVGNSWTFEEEEVLVDQIVKIGWKTPTWWRYVTMPGRSHKAIMARYYKLLPRIKEKSNVPNPNVQSKTKSKKAVKRQRQKENDVRPGKNKNRAFIQNEIFQNAWDGLYILGKAK
mmetsp:Transcript_9611/g.10948  ORF Transcript_9611/g.10948 Transcript_9611/m.10948 type:complete len:325 (-) Transcript_9611:2-976(-)|eukprot:CAMPEP_0184006722 /NCGR_PEP_ID=MMETSP0954-20121128/869_1 /TAXON_ID=627963 /ORGANISM="Aplanochytrium sp, Strain PBS07" /LENGTH=324 /DNA_ID=CAMNT_0026285339 /DNA_START=236 /DNA_END=1210 /DNA_ORIENTATION=-